MTDLLDFAAGLARAQAATIQPPAFNETDEIVRALRIIHKAGLTLYDIAKCEPTESYTFKRVQDLLPELNEVYTLLESLRQPHSPS